MTNLPLNVLNTEKHEELQKLDYYMGFDLGSNSAAIAVTDLKYQPLRIKGKDLFLVGGFCDTKTSKERTKSRGVRHREQGEAARKNILYHIFEPHMKEVDSLFRQRMLNSNRHLEDKDSEVQTKYSLFDFKDYTDEDFYNATGYSTMTHLKLALIKDTVPHDEKYILLLYIALNHYMSHGGNFLDKTIKEDGTIKSLRELYLEFCNEVKKAFGLELPQDIDVDGFSDIINDKELGKAKKGQKIKEYLNITNKTKDYAKIGIILSILCGSKVSIKKFMKVSEDCDKVSICLETFNYDAMIYEINEATNNEYEDFLNSLVCLYNGSKIANLMKGHDYISEVRVAMFETYGQQLNLLKKTVKRLLSLKEYVAMFRDCSVSGSYTAYSKSNLRNGEKERRTSPQEGRDKKVFYTYVNKKLEDFKGDKDVDQILNAIENDNFLIKQMSAMNGIIPNRLYINELIAILKNAEKYLDFLSKVDSESGLTISKEIIEVFKFRIPYWAGPLNEKNIRGWVKRLEDGRITPWNFKKKIDEEITASLFVTRNVKDCTYISGEKVLPQGSMLYEKFAILNNLNSLRINGIRIDVQLKQDIFNDLFQGEKNVTKKVLVDYLIEKNAIEDEKQLSGFDINVTKQLATYNQFKTILGEKINDKKYQELAEDVVFWCSVFGETRRFITSNIQKKYGELLSEKEISRLSRMKFSGWGKISKKFLELKGIEKESGNTYTIMESLWNTNYNLMELINSEKYTYKEEIEKYSTQINKTLFTITYEDLDGYYFGVQQKRIIWKAIKMMREVVSLLGGFPSRIFIEMARDNETQKKKNKGKKTKSRYEILSEILGNVKDPNHNWIDELNEAQEKGWLKSNKCYLYFKQLGKCMYTYKDIPLSQLMQGNSGFDIDHIILKSLTNDNNLENNLVLSDKIFNEEVKGDKPIGKDVVQKRYAFWKHLLDLKLITEEKMSRLIRSSELTDEEKANFIARQLIETQQGTKGLASILKKIMPDVTIVYSKAGNVSEFRQYFDLPKTRMMNNNHHAHDAYLNIVVGNVFYTKFTCSPMNYIKNESKDKDGKYSYNLYKMYKHDVIRNGETAWIAPDDDKHGGTIETVRKALLTTRITETKMPFIGHGKLFDVNPVSAKIAAKNPKRYHPIKSSNPIFSNMEKYGAYGNCTTAYFFLVEHTQKKKRIRTIERVPLAIAKKINSKEDLEKYCVDVLELINPDIRIEKILNHSMIEFNGYCTYISGVSGNNLIFWNAVPLVLDNKWIWYVKKLEKLAKYGQIDKMLNVEQNKELYEALLEKYATKAFISRPVKILDRLKEKQEVFNNLPMKEQCDVLIQMFKLTAIQPSCSADLTKIGLVKSFGNMYINKEITKLNTAYLIHQSETGLIQRRINLKTI